MIVSIFTGGLPALNPVGASCTEHVAVLGPLNHDPHPGEAQNILGLTLRLVVIDEAQLVPISIIDDALEPTLSTTNGRIILIGTAIEDTSSYMYHVIESVENQTNFNLPDLPTARYLRVSVDENPMTHPKKRAQIQARQAEPAIRRQYYNVW